MSFYLTYIRKTLRNTVWVHRFDTIDKRTSELSTLLIDDYNTFDDLDSLLLYLNTEAPPRMWISVKASQRELISRLPVSVIKLSINVSGTIDMFETINDLNQLNILSIYMPSKRHNGELNNLINFLRTTTISEVSISNIQNKNEIEMIYEAMPNIALVKH